MTDLRARLEADLAEAERKAWDALARYKFFMFGYHAADWVKINRRLGGALPNPFLALVKAARREYQARLLFQIDWPPSEHGFAWYWGAHQQDGTREVYRARVAASPESGTERARASEDGSASARPAAQGAPP